MIRFWAETNTAIPSTLKISRPLNSPCPDSRGATPRQDISTAAIPATANSMSSSRARRSMASGGAPPHFGPATTQEAYECFGCGW